MPAARRPPLARVPFEFRSFASGTIAALQIRRGGGSSKGDILAECPLCYLQVIHPPVISDQPCTAESLPTIRLPPVAMACQTRRIADERRVLDNGKGGGGSCAGPGVFYFSVG